MKREYIKHFLIMTGLNALLITLASAGAVEIKNEISASCSSQEVAKKVVLALPEKLYKIRTETEMIEEKSSQEMQMKNDASKWTEAEIEKFSYNLEQTEKYKKFESERASLYKPYMQSSEMTLKFTLDGDYVSACNSGIVMQFVEIELNKLMDNQWQYMLIEMDSAVSKSRSPKN